MAESWGGLSSLINVNELNDYVRHQAQDLQGFAQLCNPPTGKALGRGKGDTMQYEYFPNISNTGGLLDENEEIPEGSVTPIKGTYTLAEYGNSIRFTRKLDELSRLAVEDDFMKALTDDMKKSINTAAFNEFNSTLWLASFSSTPANNTFVTTGTASIACTADMALANLRFLVKKARLKLIPTFDGESYVYITGPESMDALVFDSAVSSMLQYDSGRAALNGEVGRIAGTRLCIDTHKIAKVGGTSSGAGANLDTGFLVGGDAVLMEYAVSPEMLVQVKDFGRSKAVAWYFIGAWKKILGQTLHSKEHVIKVASA